MSRGYNDRQPANTARCRNESHTSRYTNSVLFSYPTTKISTKVANSSIKTSEESLKKREDRKNIRETPVYIQNQREETKLSFCFFPIHY